MTPNPADIDEISDFWSRNAYFKGIDQVRLRKHLLWKYDPKHTQLWTVQKQGRTIGCCGRIKTVLLSDGKVLCKGAWGIDSLVEHGLNKEDRRCIFLKVLRNVLLEGYRKNEPEIVLSFPNEVVRDTYLRIGCLAIPIFFKYSRAMSSGSPQKTDLGASDLRFSLIKRFDRRWDELWKKFSRSYSLIVLREHGYLNWRYFKNLDNKYIVLLVKLKEEIKGYLVLREGKVLGKKAGHIVDFLVEQGNNGFDRMLIGKAILFLSLRGCSVIDAHVSHKRYEDIFVSLGFKKERTDFVVFSRFSRLLKRTVERQSNWFFTSGDGDFEMES
jgi:hypothetical protein